MKKLLAMVLALVMTLSLAVSANAFKDDKSISDDYAEAVAVLNGMGVFKGYEDGSFQPKGDITRAEVSAIVYRVYTQDVKDAKASMYATYNKFSDMAGAGWAQGYIGYCANAELVKGYPDGTFKPSGKVTGYEVLAMILRAVGYDKNGEFSGADWALHVAQTAQQAGVLKNVKGIDLNAPATRELVAELLFRAIAEASTVTYTPAFGYVTDKVLKNGETTLGYKNFKLVGAASSDDWGRPGTKWTYNVGDKETLVNDKPVVSYTTKVAECDIAKDLGITKTKALEGAFIDGEDYAKKLTDEDVTSNKVASINPLATTSYVGAQGRLTEVYEMDKGTYRIVEINTYLAQITKVTAATTDRNGHTDKATVNVKVFSDAAYVDTKTNKEVQPTWTFEKVEAEGFTVDQYVLVTVLHPELYAKKGASVESIVAAEVVAGGKLTGWTNEVGTTAATSVVAGTTYNDANKFFLNWRKAGSSWLVALDSYGNAIGLVESSSSYAAIARIEWKANSTSFGGYALADLILADGSVKENVTVASVNDKAANAAGNSTDGSYYTKGVPSKGSVSIWWENNDAYYNHIVSYSVNADGSYNLMDATHYTNAETKSDKIIDLGYTQGNEDAVGTAYYDNGSATLTEDQRNATTLVATDNTVFLYINENGYSYTVYVGKDKAPSISEAKMCVKYDANGYAEFVVVRTYTDASNTFLAYVADKTIDGYAYPDNVQVAGYDVYKIGSTEKTRVFDAKLGVNDKAVANNVFATKFTVSGLYEITVNADGWIVDMDDMTRVMADNGDNYAEETTSDYLTVVDYGFVKANPVGRSFELADKDGVAQLQYNVLDTTKVIKVLKYKNETVLETGDIKDITKDSPAIVTFDVASTIKSYKVDADTVYVIIDKDDVATVKDYAVAVRKTFTDNINLTGNSINVENYKITESVNGADATNYAYLEATATAKIEKMTLDPLTGKWEYKDYTTVEWTVTCPADGETMSALLGSGSVALAEGTYRVTVTVSNDDIGALKIGPQEFVLK